MRSKFIRVLFIMIFTIAATYAQTEEIPTTYEQIVADINAHNRDTQMDEYIGKEVPVELIDEIIGAKSHCGHGTAIPESESRGVGVYHSTNWRESSISVVVLSHNFYDENREFKQILIDYMVWDERGFNRFKELYPDVQVSFQGGLIYGYSDEYAFAIGYFDTTGEERNRYRTKAIKVWGVRKSDWKFIEIPNEGLYALNEGFGV